MLWYHGNKVFCLGGCVFKFGIVRIPPFDAVVAYLTVRPWIKSGPISEQELPQLAAATNSKHSPRDAGEKKHRPLFFALQNKIISNWN